MDSKKLVLIISSVLLISIAAAEIEFRDENPIQFYTPLDMNNNVITNIADGEGSQDAVTVSQVGGDYVEVSGDIMEGNLDMDGSNIWETGNITMDEEPSCIGKYC